MGRLLASIIFTLCVATVSWGQVSGTGSKVIKVPSSGAADKAVNAIGNITTTATINWANGNVQTATLTGNTTLTFSNPTNGQIYTLILTQDVVGGWVVTWPSLTWVGDGVAQPVGTTAERSSRFDFVYNGTDYTATHLKLFVDTDTGVLNLQDAYSGGKLILLSGTGDANGITIGVDGDADGNCDGTGGDQCWLFSIDGALGAQLRATPDGPTRINTPNGFDTIFRHAGTAYLTWANATGKFNLSGISQFLKSVEVQGHEFGAVTYAEAALVANKPVTGYFTATDIDTDGLDFNFRTPLNWNAGTVTVSLCAASVDATPTGNLVMSCSGQAVSDGDVIANRATTGEQTVTLALATQYKEECATSAAITITGTPAAGDHVYMHCDVDATLSTVNTEISALRINSMAKVFYTVSSMDEK